MTKQFLGPIVSDDEITQELRGRKKKDIYKTVSASNKGLIVKKVTLEEADGWKIFRRNKKSTRMSKPKPDDERLEDEVWCIFAQMGFKEMSKGRQFTISVGDKVQPRQIDIFAKDNETVNIVECTHRKIPGKKNMVPLIEKIQAIREHTIKSIKRHYGRQTKLKTGFVIATRNIVWSDADRKKCEIAKITILTDDELDYYASLVRHLKHAARYQLLAHIFEGQKIEGLASEVLATRGKMGGNTFYTFMALPDELLKIAYVGHKASREIENLQTYQRMLQPKRLKTISDYINEGGKFPTNIVLNLKSKYLKFEAQAKIGDEEFGKLYLPANYASAWVIDGQHRLYGYAYARESDGFKQDKSMLPVLAFVNLPSEDEMNLFIDINSKQVKVRTSLLMELYSDLHWNSTDTGQAFQALLSRVASRLNTQKTSPLYDRIVVIGKKKTSYRCLTLTSISDGLNQSKLLGRMSNDVFFPGPLSTAKQFANRENLQKGVSVLSECLNLFSTQLGSLSGDNLYK